MSTGGILPYHRNRIKLTQPDLNFHELPEKEFFASLDTNPQGLTSEEAAVRIEHYGPNDISHIRRQSVIIQFLAHFKNLLVIILLIAAAISLFVGEITDAAIITVIIFASVTLDFFQEYRAENAAELLKQKIVTRATVYRDARRQEIPMGDLVPGDLVFLSAGDIVPADARVIIARDFFVNQSALTGEPYPVEKTAAVLHPAHRSQTPQIMSFLALLLSAAAQMRLSRKPAS